MARSRPVKGRKRGRRRKGRGRSWVKGGVLATAALAVVGLAVAGPLFGRSGQAPAAGTAEQVKPGRTPLIGAGGGEVRQGAAQAAGAGAEKQEPEPVPEPKDDGEHGERASGPSEHTDVKAAEYFQRTSDKAGKRVKDVRSVGGYLRIYTDLPESADNSSQAIELCRRGLRYLVEEQRAADPVVFVQGEFGENGNPVLANILGSGDDNCRVTHPEPE